MPPSPPHCPLCGAYVHDAMTHAGWHADTENLEAQGRTRLDLYGAILDSGAALTDPARFALDETLRLPPITDTVRRRPPVPAVRDLAGAELLRALADAIDADDDLDGEEL